MFGMMSRWFSRVPSLLAFLAVVSVSVVLAPAPARAQVPDAASVRLAPGDFLRIAVMGRPDLSGDFVIAPDGTITHPLLREVHATDVPVAQVEPRIRAFLNKYMAEPAFVISPMIHVFVGGAVLRAGTYLAPPGTTIDQAVLLSGGVAPEGKFNEVDLMRDRTQTHIDLEADGTRAGGMLVQSGDQLYVPRQKNVMRDVVIPTIMVLGSLTGIANLIITVSRPR